jgi:hypothetical protein
MASPGGQGSAPARAVVALYEAIRDSRIEDVLALVDPDVTCKPLVRPGLSAYQGRTAWPTSSATCTPSTAATRQR